MASVSSTVGSGSERTPASERKADAQTTAHLGIKAENVENELSFSLILSNRLRRALSAFEGPTSAVLLPVSVLTPSIASFSARLR